MPRQRAEFRSTTKPSSANIAFLGKKPTKLVRANVYCYQAILLRMRFSAETRVHLVLDLIEDYFANWFKFGKYSGATAKPFY